MAGMQIAQMAAQGTGAILSAWGGYENSKAEARTLGKNAEIATQMSKNAADQERRKYKLLAGSQKAQYGASGVDVNVGTPLDVMAATDGEGAASAMQLLYGGELEAWNYKAEAQKKKSQAKAALLGTLVDPLGWMIKTPYNQKGSESTSFGSVLSTGHKMYGEGGSGFSFFGPGR
jgi:hypothetical protein